MARHVLGSVDLVREITHFQAGVAVEVRPFARCRRATTVIGHFTTFCCPDTAALALHDLHTALLGPWFAIHDDLRRVLAHAPLWRDLLMYYAAFHGRLELLQRLQGRRDLPHLLDVAAWSGHVAVVAYLDQEGFTGCTHRAVDLAAAAGSEEVVAYLLSRRKEGCSERALDGAAARGALDV
ncbi:hypothetical protein ACHHYP_03870, partial [Achlya hypogyna]